MTILVDRRKGSAELQPLLKSPSAITTLSYADFAFTGNGPHELVSIGVERKAIDDLVSSMESGRLAGHQLVGLLNCYHYVYLVVEGLWITNEHSRLLCVRRGKKWPPLHHGQRQYTGKEVNRFLNSLSVQCGVIPWRTSTKAQTALWVDDLYSWWQKEWDDHHSLSRFRDSPQPGSIINLSKPGVVARVAKEVDGIGWDRAKAIARLFPTVDTLVNATVKELMLVDGVGKSLAETIHRTFHT